MVFPITNYFDSQTLRQSIYHGDPHTVQSSGNLVPTFISSEFSSRMEDTENRFQS